MGENDGTTKLTSSFAETTAGENCTFSVQKHNTNLVGTKVKGS